MTLKDTSIPTRFGLICGMIAALATPVLASGAKSVRAPDSMVQMIADPRSGLAMFGYDPVAFHSEGQAMPGKAMFTATVGGLEWRFISASNRAVFLADPTDYLPLFGGHDGHAVSQNRLIWGDPAIFLLAGGRTVFFRSEKERDAYAQDQQVRSKAQQLWPEVAAQFAGH